MSGGKGPKRKGDKMEYETRDWFRSLGFEAVRVYMSGAMGHLHDELKGDVRVGLTTRDWVVQCKHQRNGWVGLYKLLASDEKPDILVVRADKSKKLIIMDEDRFAELAGRTSDSKLQVPLVRTPDQDETS